MIITLCGFMGAGKTGIGKTLSARLKAHLVDLDAYIENNAGCSVSEFFTRNGEAAFRAEELRSLKELVTSHNSMNSTNGDAILVISLGGGTPTAPECATIIKEQTFCIYLTCSVKELAFRLRETAAKRPLIAARENKNLEEWIKEMLEKREPAYKECSRFLTDTTVWNKPAIVNEIILELERRGEI